MKEQGNHPSLIAKILEERNRDKAERQSILEARGKLPELIQGFQTLFDKHSLEPVLPEHVLKSYQRLDLITSEEQRDMELLLTEMSFAGQALFDMRLDCSIKTEENPIAVKIETQKFHIYKKGWKTSSSYTIDVEELDFKYEIAPDRGKKVSRDWVSISNGERLIYGRPHSSRPRWQREITMDDYDELSGLLQVLQDGDNVELKSISYEHRDFGC